MRNPRRTATRFTATLTLGYLLTFNQFAYAQEQETLIVPGLAAPVSVIVDRWGVAHITANNEHDLFFAQGFQAARDRLFQFELWRRQATGTVAEIVGRRELKRDIGARLLQFRGDLQAELNHYHPRGEQIITAYVEGVNAWIDRTRQNPALLPIEFQLLDIRPQYWTPEIVVSRHQGLVQNLTEELALGRSVALIGADRVKDLMDFHPGEPEIVLDPKIDGTLLMADILELYRAARSPLNFRPEDLATGARVSSATNERSSPVIAELLNPPFLSHFGTEVWRPSSQRDIGSNNWVVAGSRTRSGSPLLANDPHRRLQVPSLRYFAHLQAPGWNVIGGGEPVLPGISIGHNETGAWGLTVFAIDAEDLYVYETDPKNPLRYRYGDGWEEMKVVHATIPVKGEPPVAVDLKFTRHGPVLSENDEFHRAYALRAGWLEIGGAPYLASLRMDVAGSWEEFRDACSYSHLPGENMVWADRAGNIGWQAVGVAPLRPNWNGLVPVPGDGRFEWEPLHLPIRDLPHLHNPAQGYWNTSNEALLPPDYAHRRAVGWSWANPFRGDRVREVLAASQEHTVEASIQLQLDEMSLPARQLVPLLRESLADNPLYAPIIDLLRNWDYQLRHDSSAAGLYAMWERRLEANVRSRLVPESAARYLPDLSLRKILNWLNSPDKRWGSDPRRERDALLRTSLDEAIAELTRRFGPDPVQWKYGGAKFKHVQIRHSLSAAVNDDLRKQLDTSLLPRGGNSYTVNNTGSEERQPSGGSFRVVIDTGDWDRSVATNSPGQSGDPASPHYRDLFVDWSNGRYFPLLYSPDKIDAAASRRTIFQPAK